MPAANVFVHIYTIMKRTVYVFQLTLLLFTNCAEQVVPVGKVDKLLTTANYSIVIQVLPGYAYGEVAEAAQSTITPSYFEVIDMGSQTFTIKTLRFRYEQVQPKDMAKMQRQISRCNGVVSASITNE